MKITGGISKIGDIEVFSSGKRKRSIVLYTQEKKSREFEIHFYDENIEQLENLGNRDSVIIRFTLDSEVFEDDSGKTYFTHIIGLEILWHKKYY